MGIKDMVVRSSSDELIKAKQIKGSSKMIIRYLELAERLGKQENSKSEAENYYRLARTELGKLQSTLIELQTLLNGNGNNR